MKRRYTAWDGNPSFFLVNVGVLINDGTIHVGIVACIRISRHKSLQRRSSRCRPLMRISTRLRSRNRWITLSIHASSRPHQKIHCATNTISSANSHDSISANSDEIYYHYRIEKREKDFTESKSAKRILPNRKCETESEQTIKRT